MADRVEEMVLMLFSMEERIPLISFREASPESEDRAEDEETAESSDSAELSAPVPAE